MIGRHINPKLLGATGSGIHRPSTASSLHDHDLHRLPLLQTNIFGLTGALGSLLRWAMPTKSAFVSALRNLCQPKQIVEQGQCPLLALPQWLDDKVAPQIGQPQPHSRQDKPPPCRKGDDYR